MAAINGPTTLLAWQEHDDAVFDRRGPLAQVVLASRTSDRRLSRVAVAGTAVHGVPGPTAVAGYGRSGAIVAWAANPPGLRRLRVTTTSLRGRGAHPVTVSAPGAQVRSPVARSDGRGGAVVAWQSWHRHRASVFVYLRRAGAARGRVLRLSRPGTHIDGPLLAGDGRGRVLIAWIRDGVLHYAAGTIAGGLRERQAPATDGRASELAVNGEPVGDPIVAWHDSRGIAAAEVRLR